MPGGQLTQILIHIRRLAGAAESAADDASLLDRFTARRDEAAFAALVGRHGPLVLGVCRRLLRHEQDAEDAFQATFLVLARKAGAVRRGAALAGWLYEVAYHIALRARGRVAKTQSHVKQVENMETADRDAGAAWRDVLPVLDEEVRRLPEKYRLPLLLCYFEGKTHAEAARALGCPAGSVHSRLTRARELLRGRLSARGVTLSVGGLTTLLAEAASAAAPATALILPTVRAAVAFAAGETAALSGQAVALAEGALKALFTIKVKVGLAVLLTVSLAVGGTGLLAQSSSDVEALAAPLAAPAKAEAGAAPVKSVRSDRYGDPLPEGAVARLGTVRFRHPFWVSGLAYSPDGKTLASACWDGTVRLWDPTTGRETGCFRHEPNPVPDRGSVSFLGTAISPDGKRLMAVGNLGTAHIWDLGTGKVLHSLKGKYAFGLALSRDGTTLAIGNEGKVQLWDPTTGQQVRELKAAARVVGAVAFSPDAKILAGGEIGSSDNFRAGLEKGDCTVRLWDAASGGQLRQLDGHTGNVTAVAFAPDGKTLVSAGHDATLRFWDPATGKLIRKVQVPDNSNPTVQREEVKGIHYGGVVSVAFSPDGRRLASGSYDGMVRLWDAATGRELHALRGHGREVASVTFSPDGKVLASGSRDHSIRLWDAAHGTLLQPREGLDGPVWNAAVSSDGRLAAVCCENGASVWSLESRRQLHVFRHNALVNYAAFSPDGRALAFKSIDGTVHIWDTATSREQGSADSDTNSFAALIPQENVLLVVGRDGVLRLVDSTGTKQPRVIADAGHAEEMQTSLDGKILAAADNAAVRVIDVTTGKGIRRFDAAWPRFALSPDGRTLALQGRNERQLNLWSVATGESLGSVAGLDWATGSAGRANYVFSPDSRLIARIGPDRTIELWEGATGKIRRRFRGHQGYIGPLAFTPDGKTLLTGSEDTTVLIWDVVRLQDRPGRLTDAKLQAGWRVLSGDDAEKADRAVCTFAARGGESVPFLERQLRPAHFADEERWTRLIVDLDSDRFAVRERATQELERGGEQAETVLRQALKKNPSLDARRRMEHSLSRLRALPLTSEMLRSLRAVEVLKRVGALEARQVLNRLAKGASEARLTREAKAALERLGRRGVAEP